MDLRFFLYMFVSRMAFPSGWRNLVFCVAYSKSTWFFFPRTGSRGLETEVQVPKSKLFLCRESKRYVFNDFWLFLTSLTCIGSSGRFVGRNSPQVSSKSVLVTPNYLQKLAQRTKNKKIIRQLSVPKLIREQKPTEGQTSTRTDQSNRER